MLLRSWGTAIIFTVMLAIAGRAQQDQQSQPQNLPSFAKAESAKRDKVPQLPRCPAKFEDSLEANGIAPVGDIDGVAFPKPIFTPEAKISEKALKEMSRRHVGLEASTLAFVVDTSGKTTDLCVQKSAEFGLDEEAARAVGQYRFEPAMKDGRPVAKRQTAEVSFHLF